MCVFTAWLQRGACFSLFPSCFSGKSLSDVEKSWFLLERAEHERERALQEALLLLENLEQLAQKFRRKVAEPEVFCYMYQTRKGSNPTAIFALCVPCVCSTDSNFSVFV